MAQSVSKSVRVGELQEATMKRSLSEEMELLDYPFCSWRSKVRLMRQGAELRRRTRVQRVQVVLAVNACFHFQS